MNKSVKIELIKVYLFTCHLTDFHGNQRSPKRISEEHIEHLYSAVVWVLNGACGCYFVD